MEVMQHEEYCGKCVLDSDPIASTELGLDVGDND